MALDFTYRLLTEKDLISIQRLQEAVCAALENPEILQPLSESELLHILKGRGAMLGIFVDSQLIAFRALLKPDVEEEEHLGIDVGAEDLSRVLYQEISNVHPEFRGHGLQKTMAKLIMQEADLNAVDWICATVMPYNIASLKDKFAQGMQIFALKYKYGGKLRYVFGKKLGVEVALTSEEVLVSMGDTEAQQQLLANGYVGIGMQSSNGDWLVQYRK
ncbi:GNAT family N-acetyltransferase [Lysinibacillus sp. 54212]|uniref:GNAT family N-acetyltransferase n=1 Tax=Lysinibacillus sp. 54212 TaxID=3119829 RepID=UPI002FCA3E49